MKKVTSLLAALLLPALSAPADLIGWWDFEEGTGATTADKSAGAHTGTLGSGATWSTTEIAPVPTGSTASICFDGTDLAHVLITGYKATEIGDTNPRTLAAWIKSAPGVVPTASNLGIFGYGENAAGDKWNFRTQNQNGPIDGNIRVEVNGGYIIGSTVVIDGQWHHVAMTWENDGTPNVTDVLLYVDGVLETISISLDEPIHTDTVNGIDLAISDDHSNREWNGWLDEIRIYDEALSPEQIMELATGTPIINSFTADVEIVPVGRGTVILSWEVGEFDTLVIDNDVGDVAPITVAGEGSIELAPTESTTYTLEGMLDGASQTREVFVLVEEAPLINDFALIGSGVVAAGGSVVLRWNTFGATSLNITPSPGDVSGLTEVTVTPTVNTEYTLSATNDFGTTTAVVSVGIRQGGLVAHYNFTTEPNPSAIDESPGGTNSVDVTFGASSPMWLAEDAGRTGVLSFDDTPGGQIRLIAPPTVPIPGQGFSVTLWAKSDQPLQTNFGTLFANGQGGTNHFQIDADGAGNWRLHDAPSSDVSFGPIVDEWTHLALTWDGFNRAMYYNGVAVGVPSPANPGDIFDEYRMGTNRANDGNGPVDAEIDDVRVYDFALDEAGVLAAMNDGGSAPEFAITSIVYDKAAGSVTLTWNSIAGRSYAIDESVDLASDNWLEVTDSWPSEGSETSFTRMAIDGEPARLYYRVREE